jgi:NitT/TauT family transport system substrate-binding protein
MAGIKSAAATLLLVSLLTPMIAAHAEDNYVIRYGMSSALCETVMLAAYEKGFMAAEGVKIEIVKVAPGTQYELLGTGMVDAGLVLMEQAIPAFVNGLNVKIVTGLHSGCNQILVNPSSGIAQPADLKGKRIGVHSLTAGPYMFATRVLATMGIKTGTRDPEVEFVIIPNSELPLALANGAVDAIAVFDPVGPKSIADFGFVSIANMSTLEPFASQVCCVALVSDSFVEKHPQEAAKFAIALQKAAQWISEGNEEELGEIAFSKNYTPTNPQFNAQVYKSYRHDFDIYSIYKVYDTFAVSTKALQTIGIVDQSVDVEALRKNLFVFLNGVK